MPPTPADVTLQQVLNKANLNQLATILQKVKLGNVLSPVKVVVTGLSAADSIDITSTAVRQAATITGLERESGDNLPPILCIKSLRVTAAAAGRTGAYIAQDSAATPAAPGTGAGVPVIGTCTLSADGTTLAFAGTSNITAFVLEYIPQSNADLSDNWVSGV